MPGEFLKIGEFITVAPVIHGSGDFAVELRRILLSERFDCLAVPLPPSFQDDVEAGIDRLPHISAVLQEESPEFEPGDSDREFPGTEFGAPDFDDDDSDESGPRMRRRVSYVPIDPCQPVIAALRIAIQERIPRAFIDLETDCFHSYSVVLPDPYALKHVSIDKFAAASLTGIPRVPSGQPTDRIRVMAARLRELEGRYQKILLVCSLTDWPWIREAYTDRLETDATDEPVNDTLLTGVRLNTLQFLLGELPFITGLYEQARSQLDDDENLSIDGLKQLLLASRDRYQQELKSLARKITPKLSSVWLKYVRNLCLIERRMTPDLYTLVIASQQIFGDQFAIELAETATTYPILPDLLEPNLPPLVSMTIGQIQLPDGSVCDAVSRLPGHPQQWRTCQLRRKPPKIDQERWQRSWNPFRQCSWPPEDVAVEKFRTHIKDAALSIMGADLARTEKFSTSLKDGLDIRETLRNWHTGDLYVKEYPPQVGNLDCVLMFFDSPSDPRDYPWRITWMAEHHDESTLALYATDFNQEMVGPGIGLARYGGTMFLFPPRPIPEVWQDPRLDFADTLEERLLGAACLHSRERHIAVLSEPPPGIGWRRMAKRFGKKLVHVPLSRFSQETVQQLRMVHVLNGHEIRSFASHFIRKA
jgi:hypothetical protein